MLLATSLAWLEGLPLVILIVVMAVIALFFGYVWIATIFRLYDFLGKAEDRHVSILKCLQRISTQLDQAK